MARHLGKKRRLEQQVETLRQRTTEMEPYLGLAQEIQQQVAKIALAGASEAPFDELFESIAKTERRKVTQQVFEKLPPEDQWAIITELFDDEELKAALALHYKSVKRILAPLVEYAPIIEQVQRDKRLDTRIIPAGQLLTLGLYLERDVNSAIRMGSSSQTCARQLKLVSTDRPGSFQVMEDAYNPKKSFYVVPEYDENVWKTTEKLSSHSIIQIGSILDNGTETSFDQFLYAGGRVDFRLTEEATMGKLHLGYAVIGEYDLFSTSDRIK